MSSSSWKLPQRLVAPTVARRGESGGSHPRVHTTTACNAFIPWCSDCNTPFARDRPSREATFAKLLETIRLSRNGVIGAVLAQLLKLVDKSFRCMANEPEPGLAIDLLRKEQYELVNMEIIDFLQPILTRGGRGWHILVGIGKRPGRSHRSHRG